MPQLNLQLRSQTRRFITLIDTLYDNRIRIVISADVPHNQLFGMKKIDDINSLDENRMLMDDLKISKDSVSVYKFEHYPNLVRLLKFQYFTNIYMYINVTYIA